MRICSCRIRKKRKMKIFDPDVYPKEKPFIEPDVYEEWEDD